MQIYVNNMQIYVNNRQTAQDSGHVFITGRKHCPQLNFACWCLGQGSKQFRVWVWKERWGDRNKEVPDVPHPP